MLGADPVGGGAVVHPGGAGKRRSFLEHAQPCAAGETLCTGKSECWASEITDPHYNNKRSPVPSQMSSLVTLQWVVSAYSHIPHAEPAEAEAEPGELCLPHYRYAPELLPALIHYTHHFHLSHQNMIYTVIYFPVLYLLSPPHVLYHLSRALHQQ